jgi:hypothetical protein
VGAVSASVRHATVAPAPWANRPNTAITTLANARPALVVAASTPRRRGAPTFPRPILRDEPHCVGHGCAACPSMTHAVAVLTRTLTLPRYTGVTLLYTRVRQPDAHDDTKRWAAAHHSASNQQAATAVSVLVVVTDCSDRPSCSESIGIRRVVSPTRLVAYSAESQHVCTPAHARGRRRGRDLFECDMRHIRNG